MLLNTATDVIIKLSTDWKILEINPAAEKYLGKKQKDILNKNYIHLFIPESTRKETENEMNRILKESSDTRFKMQIRTSGGKIDEADWSVIVLLDNYKSPCGLILSLKK
jgi:PAS domain S-box-containing protein